DLLRYRLAERKVSSLPDREEQEPDGGERSLSDELIAFPSHPFMRICDACGMRYAENKDSKEPRAEALRDHYYCAVCLEKRKEDRSIKGERFKSQDSINAFIEMHKKHIDVPDGEKVPFAWKQVIEYLPDEYVKRIPAGVERPEDFHALRGMSGGKDYLALIYADGNGMGQLLEDLRTLREVQEAAEAIDTAIYQAISFAIGKHLPLVQEGHTARFPFDLLLVGGDDIMMVTPAAPALDVAIALARAFYEQTRELTRKYGSGMKDCSLSVGVVLAPITYPFRMLYELVEKTLKSAKKAGTRPANDRKTKEQAGKAEYGDTLINFMTVTGSTSQDFETVYKSLRAKQKVGERRREAKFYATLRPYTVERLEMLLDAIREGRKKGLGRTKLHQIREAVLKMNLTTSVNEGLAVLRNWRTGQREFVTRHLYEMGQRYQESYRNIAEPGTLFPRVTFPWFADGPDTYRTSLLDFVELYDFVMREGEADEN
ncbi:MAG TPA: hypothetical protein VHD63_07530, partial [Ktedonobacteraceae bacterium]|nr:hypothetical protein [Ktedonobacteraceae bacterium]